jgi:hypothetical protein
MNWPPRVIAILSLIQIFFIVCGYLVTRSCLKIYDRFAADLYGTQAYPRSAIAEFVRSWGLWMILLTLGWCVFASARSRWEHSESSVSSIQFIGGIVLTLVLAWVFSLGAISAIRITFGGG